MTYTPASDICSDRAASRSLAICPGVEPFLHGNGTLYLLPLPGREQLQVDAPFGAWVHQLVVTKQAPDIPGEDQAALCEVLDYLTAEGYLRSASTIASDDTATHDRQVRWFGQEGLDGPARQRELAAKSVLVLGVGGLGGSVAEMLARAGVGHLVVLDHDVVEHANLPRQMLYASADVGRTKVAAAKDRLNAVAPWTRVDTVHVEVDSPDVVTRLIEQHSINLVVCAIDRPAITIKGIVERGSLPLGVPVIHGGHRPPNAYIGPFTIPGETSCYDCFHAGTVTAGNEMLEVELSANRDRNPINFPAVVWGDATTASLLVAQIVPWLAGVHETTIAGRELEVDMRTFATRFIDSAVETRCELCNVESGDRAVLRAPQVSAAAA